MICSDTTSVIISKLLYVISQAVRRVKFETVLSGIYAKYYVQIMLLLILFTLLPAKSFVLFTCRYTVKAVYNGHPWEVAG